MARKPTRKNYYRNSAAKRQARRMGRLRLGLKLLSGAMLLSALSFLFVFGYDYLTQCAYFPARHLDVSGQERLLPVEIIRQSRLASDANILSVNLSLTRKRLLAHPWIAEAEVSRELPDRIHIRVREHHALAVLDLERKFLINREGEIFKELTTGDPKAIPVVTGLEFSDIRIHGQRGTDTFEAVMDVLRLGEKPGTILPNSALKRIEVDREIGLTLHAFDRTKIIKIGYQNYPAKYRRLRSAMVFLAGDHGQIDFTSIDLNHSNRIVVSPVQAKLTGGENEEV